MDLNKIPVIYNINLLNNIFEKIDIKNNQVICKTDIIKKDLEDKIKDSNNTYNITFFVSKKSYKINESSFFYTQFENSNSDILPIYKKQDDLLKFIEWYKVNYTKNKIDIFETDKFTKRKYYFNNDKDCLNSINYVPSNPKHKHYDHIFYHASDQEDLDKYGYLYIMSLFKDIDNKIENERNVLNNLDINIWEKYETSFESIINSLNYVFEKFRKGTLVGIKNNKLCIFLPFSNYNFRNNYFTELYVNSEDKKLLEKHRENLENNKFDHILDTKLKENIKDFFIKNRLKTDNIDFDRTKWLANGCFFRYEKTEGDKALSVFRYFLEDLCRSRKVPDSIFILNVRDHPLIRKDLYESYNLILNKKIEDKYIKDKYLPILSVGTSVFNADIPIPTQDDIIRENEYYFPDDCKKPSKIKEISWKNKKEIAIFRGSATGCYIDNKNIRIKAMELSKKHPDLLDSGITSLNRKIKKEKDKELNIISNIKKSNFITNDEKAEHKYILNLDGHVSAFRLGQELSIVNSIVLIPQTKFKLWFSYLLKPYVHFVPVDHDLSDLISKIKWCKQNDNKCLEISKNGNEFYSKYLTRNGQLDYMQKLLGQLKFNNLNFKKYDLNIAIVIIYRNVNDNSRLEQKNKYLYFMNGILKDICSYKIILVEQSKNDKFNIGKLKNIGYDYLVNKLKLKFDNFIFSDIDMLPDKDLLDYYFKTTDSLNTLAVFGTRYEQIDQRDNRPFAGGVISCSEQVFKKLNGYPNNYYGWQGEDENLLLRLASETNKYYSPSKGRVIDIEENNEYKTKNIISKLNELKLNNEKENLSWEKTVNYHDYKKNGINSLHYKILEEHKNNNNIFIIVDLLYEESNIKNPEFYNYKSINKEEYTKVKQKIKNLKKITF